MSTENAWMEEARMIAAQCWCDTETSHKVMDPVLCEAVAIRISNWMDTAAQNQRNADYYRGLLVRCGEAIGNRAYIADDGSRSEDVLCAKIPELVDAAFCNGPGTKGGVKMGYVWIVERKLGNKWIPITDEVYSGRMDAYISAESLIGEYLSPQFRAKKYIMEE